MATTPSVVTPSLFGKVSTSFCCPCCLSSACWHICHKTQRDDHMYVSTSYLVLCNKDVGRIFSTKCFSVCLICFGGKIYEIKFGPLYPLAVRLLATVLNPWASTHLCLRLGRGRGILLWLHAYMTHVHESISQNNYFLSLLSPRGLF